MVCATFVRRILLPIIVLGATVAQAQTISKVAGDGQLVIQSIQSSNPLVVLVRDAGGNPVKNAVVKWAITSGPGTVVVLSSPTDAKGQASAAFIASVPNPQQSYVTSTVTASYNSANVVFTEVSVGTTANTSNVQAFPTPLPSGAVLSGAAGAQGSTPISVRFLVTQGPQSGQGIGNVAVTTSMLDPNDPSTIACAGGTIYSNAAGVATCNLVYGGKIGQGSFNLSAGGLQNFTYTYKVVAGAPAVINIISGNNQSGTPGQKLPFPLLGQLTDIGGNTLAGVPMTFSSTPPGAISFSNFNSATDSTGRISAAATLGNVVGAVQAKLSTADGKVSATFTLTVNIVVAGLNYVSGDQQSGLVNTQYPNPLVVQVVNPNSQPVQGANVAFTLSSGSAILSSNNVVTDANGRAAISVTAGPTAGPIVVIASTTTPANTYSYTFNLTSTPPGPVCDPDSTFFNGVSYVPNFIAPGGIALIYCKGLAPGIQGIVATQTFGFEPLPTQVQNVTVEFNGVKAPIYYLANQNGQEWVAVQVPFETPTGAVPVTITSTNNQQNVNPVTAQVSPAAPGFFEYQESDGVTRAVAIRPDGSVVDVNNRAQKGEVIRIFVTGLIPPTNDSGNSVIGTNQYAPLGDDITITTPVIFGIGGQGFGAPTVVYAHSLIGVWEVQFTVPDGAKSGPNVALDMIIPVNGKNYHARGTKISIQ